MTIIHNYTKTITFHLFLMTKDGTQPFNQADGTKWVVTDAHAKQDITDRQHLRWCHHQHVVSTDSPVPRLETKFPRKQTAQCQMQQHHPAYHSVTSTTEMLIEKLTDKWLHVRINSKDKGSRPTNKICTEYIYNAKQIDHKCTFI